MHNLKQTTQTLLLVLAVALLAIPPITLRSQVQDRSKNSKSVAVLRRQGQPSSAPTAQEVIDYERGRFSQAEKAKAFRRGRELLVKKGVPFEPTVLLKDSWRQKLKEVFLQMPELQEVRRGGKKLKGAQLADTLFLPEKIELDGDTVILVKRLIFEGRDVLIKGNYDVHIFTIEPTILTEEARQSNEQAARGGKAQFLNIGFNASSELRRFASRLRPVENGRITIDTSGIGRKEWLESQRQRKSAAGQPEAGMIKAGFSSGSLLITPQASQDASGQRGADGINGEPGGAGTNGNNGQNGASGICGSNVNGAPGRGGYFGGTGDDGKNGEAGTNGGDARPITLDIKEGDTQTYRLIAKGGDGGWGGAGGAGGTGGRGGDGGNGGNGADCPCNQGGSGEGGDGGYAGAGGYGGDGGRGGNGGNGGNGELITIKYPVGYDINKISHDSQQGWGGRGGAQGTSGHPGSFGAHGQGGKGARGLVCLGTAGRDGTGGGPSPYTPGYGQHGELGTPGENGKPGGLNLVPTREELDGGGGGGGTGKGNNIQAYNYYECTSYYWVLYNSWDDGRTWFEVDRWYAGCW